MAATVSAPEVEQSVEVPHVVYPKGPIRRIVRRESVRDAVAGSIVLVVFECGHEASLVGTLPILRPDAIVRCPQCFYESHRRPAQVVEDAEDDVT